MEKITVSKNEYLRLVAIEKIAKLFLEKKIGFSEFKQAIHREDFTRFASDYLANITQAEKELTSIK